jgi:transposase, IS5 family
MKTHIPERQLHMFETFFSDLLNPEHEILRAASLIDWDGLQETLDVYYSPLGRQGKAIRLMVGIHLLKHRYNCSDEQAVETLHENSYWQCFCGFNSFQRGQILDATTLVKFRNRIGTEGMKQIESFFLKTWSEMGLVKTKRVAVDTTAQPKNIAYPTDADLLHRVREKINRQVKRVRKEVTLLKSFRTYSRSGKRLLLRIKKFHRKDPDGRKEAIKALQAMTHHVVSQGARIVNSLYSRGFKEAGKELNRLVSLGKRIVDQTKQVLLGESPKNRIYSLHESDVAVIKKGKHHPDCEFGAIISLAKNDDGLILSHREYQHNVADVKTLGQVIGTIKKNIGQAPQEITADRGFDQSLKKQENCRRRWGVKQLAIPKKGKTPHPNSDKPWFKNALKQRVKIEPVIGHLKSDHRMNRCRYKGAAGDTVNVVWATLAWNTKKVTHLHRQKEEKQAQREMKRAA